MRRVACLMLAVLFCDVSSAMTLPETVTKLTGSTGGLCVQSGLPDGGALAQEFAGTGAWLVHGFDTNPRHVAQATQRLRETAQYGLAVFEARATLDTLPFAENLVNLVIVGGYGAIYSSSVGLQPGPLLVTAGFGLVFCSAGLTLVGYWASTQRQALTAHDGTPSVNALSTGSDEL